MDEGGWASLPHGTILRVMGDKLAARVTPTEGIHRGLWRVYWVDQRNPDHPRQSIRIYTMTDCPDEMAAYAKFMKEQADDPSTTDA